jgi:hypothetical protein
MAVKYGQPYLPKPSFDESKLRKDLPRIFRKITERQIRRILALVREAEQEKHGTMLMISVGAKTEARRLKTQGTPIAPKVLTPELLRNLTPIDGAVLVNTKGTCFAIGVILDGMATEDGNPARGARYNSAIRYVKGSKHPSLAVIVSEDGGVDFLPDLLPAIRRSAIEKTVAVLRSFLEDKPVNCANYNNMMRWLEERRFYLLPQDCDEINRLMKSIDKKIDVEDPDAVKRVWKEFIPDPKMDSRLYYEP